MNGPADRGEQEMKKNKRNKDRVFRILRIILLTAAVILLIAGILNGSARDVFRKAIRICTECIGLG